MVHWGCDSPGTSQGNEKVRHLGIVPLRGKEAGELIHQPLPHPGWGHSWSIKSLALPACHTYELSTFPTPETTLRKKYTGTCQCSSISRVGWDGWMGPPQRLWCYSKILWAWSQLIPTILLLLFMLPLSPFYTGGNWSCCCSCCHYLHFT